MSFMVPMTNDGSSQRSIMLGSTYVSLVTRWNYTSKCWSLDLIDATSTVLLAGLKLIPGADILTPYTAVKALLGGSLFVYEHHDEDYKDPEKLGTDVVLIWYPDGETVL